MKTKVASICATLIILNCLSFIFHSRAEAGFVESCNRLLSPIREYFFRFPPERPINRDWGQASEHHENSTGIILKTREQVLQAVRVFAQRGDRNRTYDDEAFVTEESRARIRNAAQTLIQSFNSP